MTLRSLLIVMTVFVLSSYNAKCGLGADPEQELRKTRGMAIERGRFLLKGIVTDTQGNRLDAVSLSVRESRLSEMGTKNDSRERSHKIDGEFAIEADDANSVTIRFYRDGYYAEQLSFTTNEALPKNWDSMILRGVEIEIPPAVVKHEDLHVVLEKHGKLAEFKRVNARLQAAGAGNGTVVDLEEE